MYKLSPSDFAYLWEECKLCYYLKVKHGIYQPSMPMPGVFGAINTRLQGTLIGKDLRTLSKVLPEGIVETQEGWVESVPVPGTSVFIKGKYDLLARRPDGSYLLIDLKISQPHEDKIAKYRTQLGAYNFALANPARGRSVKVSGSGLLILYPDAVSFKDGKAVLDFPPTWLELPQGEDGFLSLVKEVDKLLVGPMPDEGKECRWCQYRHVGEKLAHEKQEGVQLDIPF
ncbi:MAG: PD-(D/E)XK nuclease family protein [Candidatus Chisholmbacteria bacterium]|nr:PD-(D/E)XK nuclease family protein [Candidatus Chisholmbacteria bacterium]